MLKPSTPFSRDSLHQPGTDRDLTGICSQRPGRGEPPAPGRLERNVRAGLEHRPNRRRVPRRGCGENPTLQVCSPTGQPCA